MSAEILIVAIIVAAAAAYLARLFHRTFQGKSTGCGCGASACPKARPRQ